MTSMPINRAPTIKPFNQTVLTIVRANINKFRKGSFPMVTVINWRAGKLDAGVLSCFPNLVDLNCGYCGLMTLDGIEGCKQITILNCRNNLLSTLKGIEVCDQLVSIDCRTNRLVTLEGIEGCSQLVDLECRNNRLVTLGELEGCPLLLKLQCDQNNLITLLGIENCSGLVSLQCRDNSIGFLDTAAYLRQLRTFVFTGNPLDIQSIQTQRFLERFDPYYNRIQRDRRDTVYADRQNVHDVHIQKTVCESIRSLLQDPKPEFSMEAVIDSGLDEKAIRLILEYCSDTSVHSIHLLTYLELLGYVWARIEKSEHRSELIKILGEQVTDSECKCFTGRFNRTLSVLVGFCPDITIAISDNSRIGAIIIAAKDRVTPYDPVEHQELARTLLLEAGYDAETIEPWLEAIIED